MKRLGGKFSNIFKSAIAMVALLATSLIPAGPAFASSTFSGTLIENSGLTEIARWVGKYQVSTDATIDSGTSGTLSILKQSGAGAVAAAYLTSLSPFTSVDPVPDVTLDGDTVNYSFKQRSTTDFDNIFVNNYLADVTTIVSDYFSGTPTKDRDETNPFPFSGEVFEIPVTFPAVTTPGQDRGTSGLLLTVIFENSTISDQTISVMFGHASTTGQTTEFSFDPVGAGGASGSYLALGISWSSDRSSDQNGSGQISKLEVAANDDPFTLLSDEAGGADDSVVKTADAGLITFGGVGDSTVNNGSSYQDDELYNLDSLLTQGTSKISLRTQNPSGDDSLGMIVLSLPVTSYPEITFDANGGTGTMAKLSSTTPASITQNAFQRTGFEFTGWRDSSGNDYANGATYDFSVSTTMTAQWREIVASPIYSGPIITDVNETTNPLVASGQTATVNGSRLSGVTKAIIDGKEAEIVSVSENSFQIVIPEGIPAGTYDLQITSSIGNLTYLDAITVSGSVTSSSYGEVFAWTKRISDSQVKVYVKYPTIGEKIRIGHQTGGSGSYETVFVRTLDSETDESLTVNIHGSYIVRTIDLENINRIRVTVGDERMVQVRYNQ